MEATVTSQNGNANGDIIVVNDDNAPGNSPTTPVASRAIIQEFTTSSTTPEAYASLLPSTSSSPSGNSMPREQDSSPIPQATPAVLIIQRERSLQSNASATVDANGTRGSRSYQYPVATYATNLVRSVSDNVPLRADIPPSIGQRSTSRAALDVPATITATNDDNHCGNSNNTDVSMNNDAVPILSVLPAQAASSALSEANANPSSRNNINSEEICEADLVTNEARVLPDSIGTEFYIEGYFDEYDKYGDKTMKSSKDSANIDISLERAGEIAKDNAPSNSPTTPVASLSTSSTTLEASASLLPSPSDSVPLSEADPGDQKVHNDILKLVLVGDNVVDKSKLGGKLRKWNSTKKPKQQRRLADDVHTRIPSNAKVRFTIWEVLTSKSENPYLARPATQSLFFSDQSLYLLAYDLGASNSETFAKIDEHMNDFYLEEANREADRALEADIGERVLPWVNCIAMKWSRSAILPIALVPSNMSPEEAERRLRILKISILNYNLCDPVCVSMHNNMGLEHLKQKILEIADASVRRRVPPGTVEIRNVCRRLKEKETQKVISVDHLIGELPKKPEFSTEVVIGVLDFLSTIGEVLYFGGSDSVLKSYVILSRDWLVSVLLCIHGNYKEGKFSKTNYEQFPENPVTQFFLDDGSSCPILSRQDTKMLWQSYNFIEPTLFDFLLYLLENSDVFLPLEIDRSSSTDQIYFVPSVLTQASLRDIWIYGSRKSWVVTLCHSWLVRNGAPARIMEQVTIALLRDLYKSSHANAESPTSQSDCSLQRTQTSPHNQTPLSNSKVSHDGEPIGPIKIHQIICRENCLFVKIGRVFPKGNERRISTCEIFVAVTDQVSSHRQSNTQKLVVSGKGEVGHYGRRLWKGGYKIVLDSIEASVANFKNVERRVVCPECLAVHDSECKAHSWSWDNVLAFGDDNIHCISNHRVARHLICGTAPAAITEFDVGKFGNVQNTPVKDLFHSVVIVGLWDNDTKSITNVGSGFIANEKLGLVVTASHTLFEMSKARDFGAEYKGCRNPSAIIGLIPSGSEYAVFRYFAKVVTEDIRNMDACILKITSKLENDVNNHTLVGKQPAKDLSNIQEEKLSSLKITSCYALEQAVRLIGFNQGGEGRFEKGKHVHRTIDLAPGLIIKKFKPTDDNSSSSNGLSSSEEGVFLPKEEIVVKCNTIEGHSGGPCVDNDGKVVGILSRSDPVDCQRCYLVPSSEIKKLFTKYSNH
jgi:hypothetical protein